MDSPYDPDAPFGNKRSVTWTGYKVPRTATGDEDTLHVIPHVETTEAAGTDVTLTEPIPQALADTQLAPETPIIDAGYGDATWLVESPRDFHSALMGPGRPHISWQAQDEQAYDMRQFPIDWETQQVTCPRGTTRSAWRTRHDRWQHPVMSVQLAHKACLDCAGRPLYPKAKTAPRPRTLRPQSAHQALQAVRQQQSTEAWQAQYDKRAGSEGALSQGVRALGLRQCRSWGLPKTRLPHLATAAAINSERLASWLDGRPHAQTRLARFAALTT
jgi:transposase